MPERRQRQLLKRWSGAVRPALIALAVAAICGIASVASAETPAEEKLRLLMQGRHPGGAAPSDERLREREDLLRRGEAALAQRDVEAAERAFDRAAMILHAADTEMGLVRSYMQAGQYRRALAFGAHTAGAHLDVVGGAALYAWLLHLGGQEAVAQRLLTQAQARAPDQPLVRDVASQLRSPAPRAHGAMLLPPARLAPYGSMHGLARDARVVATGTLVGEGRFALVPLGVISTGARYWVRNGLGQLVAATVAATDGALGLALLRLATPLPAAAQFKAPADAFPGSIAFAVEYATTPDAPAAWPMLKAGFMGAALGAGGGRELGVSLAPDSPRGGPVFDQAGRLLGVAVQAGGVDHLVAVSQLQPAFKNYFVMPVDSANQKLTADAIYEPALLVTLQVIRSKRGR